MADANIRAVITAEDKTSGVMNNVGLSFGKLTAAVASGQLIANGFTAAWHGIETALHDGINFIEDSISSTLHLGQQTLLLQRNFGLTAEQASGLVAVFDRFGLSAEDASRSFSIFQKHLIDVKDSESIGVKALSVLGVKTTDVSGNLRSMNDVLLDVADKFKSGVVPATERAGVAMELFGRSGQSMIPVLMQGRDGILELEARAKEMGLVLSQDNVDAIRKNMIAQKDLQEAIGGVKLQIGNVFMPIITDLIENHLMKWIQANGGVAEIMQTRVVPIIKEVIAHIQGLIAWVIQNKDTFIAFGTAVLDVFKAIGLGITALGAIFRFFHDTVAGWIYKVISIIQTLFTWITEIPSFISKAWAGLQKIIESPFLNAFEHIKNGINDVKDVFNRVKNDITSAPGHVVSGVGGLLGKIPGFAEGGIVPGPMGAPQLAIVHGGEQVIPNGTSTSSNVNVTFNGIFMGTQQEFRQLAVKMFQAYDDAKSMGTH